MVNWDFENGNDHGFTLRSLIPATPAADDPTVAGDESLTGGWEEGNANNLPEAGVAWVVGSPAMMNGQLPGADPGRARVDSNNVLDYSLGKARIGFVNTGSLNTYSLNFHGDYVHADSNDQIATSPPVLLGANMWLSATSWGGGGAIAPEFDSDPAKGYKTGSSGIAVLLAADSSFLASVYTQNKSTYDADTLDLSDFAGQTVVIEVVDAFQGSWGWLAIDEIQINNATLVTGVESEKSSVPTQFELAQNFPNPFNPQTTIRYDLFESGFVTLTIHNATGQEIAVLENGYRHAGSHTVVWNIEGMASGVYFYKLKVGNAVKVRKLEALK